MDDDGAKELLVGSEDYEIRIFRAEQIIQEVMGFLFLFFLFCFILAVFCGTKGVCMFIKRHSNNETPNPKQWIGFIKRKKRETHLG